MYLTQHVKNNHFLEFLRVNLKYLVWEAGLKKEKHIDITNHFTLEDFLESYYFA